MLYKKNFLWLTSLILIFNVIIFLMYTFYWNNITHFIVGGYWITEEGLPALKSWEWPTIVAGFELIAWFIWSLYLNPILIFSTFLLWIWCMTILFLPIFFGTIKSIQDTLNNKEIQTWNNFIYWLKKFLSALKILWNTLRYVFCIPLIVFIIWLISVFTVMNTWIFFLLQVLFLSSIFLIILWWVYVFFKLLRVIFWILFSIERENYSYWNFKKWIILTQGKLSAIGKNFTVIGIIVLFFIFIASSLVNYITWVDSSETSGIFQILLKHNVIHTIFNESHISHSSVDSVFVINGIFSKIIESIGLVYLLVYIYILYTEIRNESEKWTKKEI